MIQISFESAFDPFHAAFRIMRQISFREAQTVSISRMKIVDVYVAEPSRCVEIRLSGPMKQAARRAAECQPPFYGKRPSTVSFFNRMAPMQDAAIETLVLHGLLDGNCYSNGQALRTEMKLPDHFADRIENVNNLEIELMNFLCNSLDKISFDGPGGLKDRTGLSEFRYDVV